MSGTGKTGTEVRPFHVDVPEERLVDLRRRIAADQSQGVPLGMMQDLAG